MSNGRSRQVFAALALLLLLTGAIIAVSRAARPGARASRTEPGRPDSEFEVDYRAPNEHVTTAEASNAKTGLDGVVQDSAGRAVDGAFVAILVREDGAAPTISSLQSRHGRSDKDGAFHVERAEGTDSTLHVRHAGYKPVALAISAETASPIVVTLERGARIVGMTKDVLLRRAIGGILVVARGMSGRLSSTLGDRFPSARSDVHRTRSAPDGTFEFRGLREGPYAIDVVGDGLAVIPRGMMVTKTGAGRRILRFGVDRPDTYGSHRALVVRPSDSEVVVPVASIGLVQYRVVDAASGVEIPGVSSGLGWTDDYLSWPNITGPEREQLVVNAKITDLDGRGLGVSVVRKYVLLTKWPRRKNLRARVVLGAPGYNRVEAEALVRSPSSTEVDTISLTGGRERTSIRLRLVDRNGNGVGPARITVRLEQPGHGAIATWIKIDESGSCPPFAMHPGRFLIRTWDSKTPPFVFRNTQGVAVSGKTVHVDLPLACAAVRFVVTAKGGTPLEGAGIRIAEGAGPIRLFKRKGQPVVGRFLIRPGVGRPTVLALRLPPTEHVVEAFRHGFAPFRVTTKLQSGLVVRVEVRMTPDDGGRWDSWQRNVEEDH